MAQPQQPQMAAVPFPQQHSPAAADGQAGFPIPTAKRPRLSPIPSQPESPYSSASPFAVSPGSLTPSGVATLTSPPLPSHMQLSSNSYLSHPYANGQTPSLPTPTPVERSASISASIAAMAGSVTPGGSAPMFNSASFAVIPAPATPGAMGPPQKPADRPAKELDYDVSDSLAGTGIDIRAEEQYMSDLYYAYDPQSSEARTGFAQGQPGGRATFYGAGPMNQPAQLTAARDHDQLDAESAEKAWDKAAAWLAGSRAQELAGAFLQVPLLMERVQRAARSHGLGLNMDVRAGAAASANMGRMRLPESFPEPEVRVRTVATPDGAVVATKGLWLPKDVFLVDQLALLSIAAKQRVRELVEDANRIASTRQRTAHGVVPDAWLDAAEPAAPAAAANRDEEELKSSARAGWESAVSPRTNPLKRSFDASFSGNGLPSATPKTATTPASSGGPAPNLLAASIRDVGRVERDAEELRLRRRLARKEGVDVGALVLASGATGGGTATPGAGGTGATGSAAASRAGSVAPGTPGSVAPDPDSVAPGGKALTKKEMKRSAAAKALEASSSHANVNRTAEAFLGGLGMGKKKKKYAWMAGGGGASGGGGGQGGGGADMAGAGIKGSPGGAATPGRLITSGLPGTPGGGGLDDAGGLAAAGAGAGGVMMNSGYYVGPDGRPGVTQDGRNRLGTWREDKEKGRNIQLRDWVVVLAEDGRDPRALQLAYDRLDGSNPK